MRDELRLLREIGDDVRLNRFLTNEFGIFEPAGEGQILTDHVGEECFEDLV